MPKAEKIRILQDNLKFTKESLGIRLLRPEKQVGYSENWSFMTGLNMPID
jgi:hypothetical protein